MELKTIDWVQRAYKKLKHSVYFDKTQLPLVDEIVKYETAGEKNIDEQLSDIADILESNDKSKWDDLVSDIIEKMGILVYTTSRRDFFSPDDVSLCSGKRITQCCVY